MGCFQRWQHVNLLFQTPMMVCFHSCQTQTMQQVASLEGEPNSPMEVHHVDEDSRAQSCRAAVSLVRVPACFLSWSRDCSSVSLRDSRHPFSTLRKKSPWWPITCRHATHGALSLEG